MRFLPILVALPVCVPLLVGQTDATEPPAPAVSSRAFDVPAVPIHTAPDDHGQRYGTWAAGRTYKVSFEGGMRFVPFLGADYPREQSWAWQTASVRIGDRELLQPGEHARMSHDDYTCRYRFGAFAEVYEVGVDGLEQTFHFDSVPTGGDLVVTGRITTELRSEPAAAAHRPLSFVDAEGREILGYGRAFAYDATGERIQLTTAHDGDRITIRVPAAWLREAQAPIVIDPIIATAPQIAGQLGEAHAIDIAYERDSFTSKVLLTASLFTSVDHRDVYAWVMERDFSNPTVIYADITASWDSDGSSCAYVGGSGRWVIAFRRLFNHNPVTASAIRCHVHFRANLSLQTSYVSLNAPADHNDWRPDVGGSQSGTTGNKALLVFHREDNTLNGGNIAATPTTRVEGVILDTVANPPSFGATFPIQGNPVIDCANACVTQVSEGGISYSWLCVLQVYNNFFGNGWTVYGWRIGNDGSVSTGSWRSDLTALGSHQQLHPIVAGRSGRYAVAFATRALTAYPGKIENTSGTESRIERLDWQHGAADPDPATDRPPEILSTATLPRLHVTGLTYDSFGRSHWVACEADAPIDVIHYHRVGYRGQVTASGLVTDVYRSTHAPCVFDEQFLDVLIATDHGGLNEGVSCHTLAYPTEIPWTAEGAGCAPTGYISWAGSQQIGSQFSQANYTGASATTIHLMALSLDPANFPMPIAPGCSVLIDPTPPDYLGTLGVQIGPDSNWPLLLPEDLVPLTLYFQNWMLDGSALTSSQRLTVPLVK